VCWRSFLLKLPNPIVYDGPFSSAPKKPRPRRRFKERGWLTGRTQLASSPYRDRGAARLHPAMMIRRTRQGSTARRGRPPCGRTDRAHTDSEQAPQNALFHGAQAAAFNCPTPKTDTPRRRFRGYMGSTYKTQPLPPFLRTHRPPSRELGKPHRTLSHSAHAHHPSMGSTHKKSSHSPPPFLRKTLPKPHRTRFPTHARIII
jgi:hypothetical protein